MNAVGTMWRTDRWQVVSLAGVGVALVAMLLNIGFLFRPGLAEVLGGLAHHAFVLGWMLLLTAGSRTVALSTLGIFWLLGVCGILALTYVLQSLLASLLGVDSDGEFMSVWLGPFVEEATKILPIAIFLLLAGRRGHRLPSMSDCMLIGFMVGAGMAFHEDAHYGDILVSGDGWGGEAPWALVFPTISEVGDRAFALNHALWAALSGLSIGVAAMFRHWRIAWVIALVGPLLALTNHILVNYLTFDPFRGAGRGTMAEPFGIVQTLTDAGRLPLLVLFAGAIAVVVIERLILRWVAKRDRMFAPISMARIFGLLGRCTTRAGATQLLAADRYLRLRRSLYFAGWRTKVAGGDPVVTEADFARLNSLATRHQAVPPAGDSPPAGDAPVAS